MNERRRVMMRAESEDDDMKEWKLLRNITVPDTLPDGGVDEDGVKWYEMSNGGFMFAFDTDYEGHPFSTERFLVRYNAGYDHTSSVVGFVNRAEYHYGLSTTILFPDGDITYGKSGGKTYGWQMYELVGMGWIAIGGHNAGAGNSTLKGGRDINTQNTNPATAISTTNSNLGAYGLSSGSTFEFWQYA